MRKTILAIFMGLATLLFSCQDDLNTPFQDQLQQKDTSVNHFYGVKQAENAPIAKGVAQRDKLWSNGTVITVKFLNDPYNMAEKVKQYASQWEKYANIKFDFVTSGKANVRIGFDWKDSKYITWSYTGTDCKYVKDQNEATVNFAFWDTANEQERQGDVLRVFGQVLGLELEHRHLSFNPGWTAKISEYWEGEITDIPWDELREYVFDPLDQRNLVQTDEYDVNSIMIWPFSRKYASNTARDYNYQLSEQDIKFIGQLYPKQANDDFVKMGINGSSYISFYMNFHEDTDFTINWGDGKVESFSIAKNVWKSFQHNYSTYENFQITINGPTNALKGLNLHRTWINSLDISKSVDLNWLRCAYTYLKTIDLSKNTKFTDLYAGESSIEHLNFSNNPDLKVVILHNSPIEQNQVELVNMIKTLPNKTEVNGEIYMLYENSINAISDLCSQKNWTIVKKAYY